MSFRDKELANDVSISTRQPLEEKSVYMTNQTDSTCICGFGRCYTFVTKERLKRFENCWTGVQHVENSGRQFFNVCCDPLWHPIGPELKDKVVSGVGLYTSIQRAGITPVVIRCATGLILILAC